VSLPAFFYITVEKKSYLQTQRQHLLHYAYGVEKTIYDFSRTKEHVFTFPRSLFYDAYLYDAKGKLLFSTSSHKHRLQEFMKPLKNLIYAKVILNANRLHAKYLVITQLFSYKEIYLRAVIAALLIGAIVFFMTLFFIKISLRPLEKVNRYLNTFFNDAMHELKTPLGVMQLNLELLRAQKETKTLRRLFSSMQSMILIYDDIEYHIKHDHVEYRSENMDMSYFVLERAEVFEDLAKAKNISIVKEIEEDIYFEINRIELQRIIDNTLSNAIKYSPRDTKINVVLRKKDAKIVLSVRDEGVGIKDTQSIFERYHREDTIQGGFGIGLSIVKHICEKYNILIKVSTKKGKGSTFSYIFVNNSA